MEIITITGNITKDAETRQAGNDTATGFGVACNSKSKGQDVARFYDVSIFGKRGEALKQYLTKGKPVTVMGRFSIREHNGKTYLQVDANEIAFGGSKDKAAGGGGAQKPPADPPTDSGGDDEPLPF